MNITLNQAEIKLARYIATSRHNNARNKNITDCQKGPQDKQSIDLEGFGAELAFCRWQNLYPDLAVDLDLKDLPDADCEHPTLGAVDVKSTTCKTGHLQCAIWKDRKNIDTFALMIGNFPQYRFAGWAKYDSLVRQSTIGNLGWGDLHLLKQKQLEMVIPK